MAAARRHRPDGGAYTRELNQALSRLSRRAERSEQPLSHTFVDIDEHVHAPLRRNDCQIIYGRRGTGKTHALKFIEGLQSSAGDVVCLVDLRQLGSPGSTMDARSRELKGRWSRLVLDILLALREQIWSNFLERGGSGFAPNTPELLDAFASQLLKQRIDGPVNIVEKHPESQDDSEAKQLRADLDLASRTANLGAQRDRSTTSRTAIEGELTTSGSVEYEMNIPGIGFHLRRLVDATPTKRVWFLLDEWNSLPRDLQPYVAEFLKRTIIPLPTIVLKIAAIEDASRFAAVVPEIGEVGLELGSEVHADLNLDDVLSFGGDIARAEKFFGDMLFRHVDAEMALIGKLNLVPTDPRDFIKGAFRTSKAFAEFVRAAGAVPRDALSIVGEAAAAAGDEKIAVANIQDAAAKVYTSTKAPRIRLNPEAYSLLLALVQTVVLDRQSKGFLMHPDQVSHDSFRYLFNERVIHLVRREISSRDHPRIRFTAYTLDYGCYVHLSRSQVHLPLTRLFEATPIGHDGDSSVQVPIDGYENVRRATVDIDSLLESYQPALDFS